MDLIQENGQPRYGRFESVPSTIHVQRYIYKTPYGKVLKGWRKQLKYKNFKFCGIQHKHYSIGLAIADIGWVGHGFSISMTMKQGKSLSGTLFSR